MANPIIVDPSTAWDVLANATGGETILMKPGDYPSFLLNHDYAHKRPTPTKTWEVPVVLASEDPVKPARIRSLETRGVSNLALRDVVGRATPDVLGKTPVVIFQIGGGQNVALENVDAGGMGATYGTAIKGFQFRNHKGGRVSNVDCHDLRIGGFLVDCEDVKVAGGAYYHLGQDGLDVQRLFGGEIAGLYMHDFENIDPALHPDGIQFWTSNSTEPSRDVHIHDIIVLQGAGSAMQGIFMGDERGLGYDRFLVENNLIYAAFPNAISADRHRGSKFRHNTCLRPKYEAQGIKESWTAYLRVQNCTDTELASNVAENFVNTGNLNLSLASNLFGRTGNVIDPAFAAMLPRAAARTAQSIADLLLPSVGSQISVATAKIILASPPRTLDISAPGNTAPPPVPAPADPCMAVKAALATSETKVAALTAQLADEEAARLAAEAERDGLKAETERLSAVVADVRKAVQ